MKLPADTLYLPIKQTYFDQIMAGTKTVEYREVREGATMSRYLIKEKNPSGYKLNPACTDPTRRYYYNDYNGGCYPFLPKPFKKAYLAVGYAKNRPTAVVEVTGITFHPEQILKDREGKPCFCWWVLELHLGKVLNMRKKRE